MFWEKYHNLIAIGVFIETSENSFSKKKKGNTAFLHKK